MGILDSRRPSLLLRTRLLLVFLLYLCLYVGVSMLTEDRTVTVVSHAHSGPDGQPTPAKVFERACMSCHTGGSGAIGPRLDGVVGRRSGSLAGFKFTEGMRSRNVVWTPETLRLFLSSPGTYVPGTSMAVGALSEEELTQLITYLEKQ